MKLLTYWESLLHNLHERRGRQLVETKLKHVYALLWQRGAATGQDNMTRVFASGFAA